MIQEIGGQRFLNELKEDLNGLGLDYPYAILMRGGLASILDGNDFYQGSDHRLIYFDLIASK